MPLDALPCDTQVCAIGALAATGCALQGSGAVYRAEDNLLCLSSDIDADGRLLSQIRKLNIRKGVRLFISGSNGGDVTNAIAISRHLRRLRYSAYVGGYCLSACAQFLFLGARRRVVVGDGVVAMHGGPPSEGELDKLELSDAAKMVAKSVIRDWLDFYRSAGIPMAVVTSMPESVKAQMAEDNRIIFWIPARADYRKYKIDVSFCGARLPEYRE